MEGKISKKKIYICILVIVISGMIGKFTYVVWKASNKILKYYPAEIKGKDIQVIIKSDEPITISGCGFSLLEETYFDDTPIIRIDDK